MSFKISGTANQVNPTQTSGHTGENLTVNNNYQAPSGNPTRGRDIPIGTGQKGKRG